MMNKIVKSANKNHNKGFFTPCRRIGLSRKSSSTRKSVISNVHPTQFNETRNIHSPEKTELLNENDQTEYMNGNIMPANVLNVEEKDNIKVFDCKEKLPEDSTSIDKGSSKISPTNNDNHLKDISTKNILVIDELKTKMNEVENELEKSKSKFKSERKESIKRHHSKAKSCSEVSSFQNSTTLDSDDDFVNSQKSNNSESMNIASLLENSVRIKRSKKSNKRKSTKFSKTNLKKTKFSFDSSSDEDFICHPITHSSKSFSDKNLDTKIRSKEIDIDNKQKLLAELKLVRSYKKMHNIEELTNSTKVWKDSFKNIITDLHSELNEGKGSVSIEELLNKFKVPKEIFCVDEFVEI